MTNQPEVLALDQNIGWKNGAPESPMIVISEHTFP